MFIFRGFWDQTEAGSGSSGGNERARFRNVLRLMQEAALAPKPKNRSKEVGKAVVSNFADGKWHDIETIAKQVGESIEDIKPALQNIVEHKTFQCTAEKRPFAKTFQYRIFPQERQESTVEMIEKIQPLLDVLKLEGRKNMATMSPPTVAFHAAKIQELLNDLQKARRAKSDCSNDCSLGGLVQAARGASRSKKGLTTKDTSDDIEPSPQQKPEL
jgi:hypothetical protein